MSYLLALVGERRPREALEEGGWRCLPPPRSGPRQPRPSAPQGSESEPGILILPLWAPSRELGGVPGTSSFPLPPFFAPLFSRRLRAVPSCSLSLALTPHGPCGPLERGGWENRLGPGHRNPWFPAAIGLTSGPFFSVF